MGSLNPNSIFFAGSKRYIQIRGADGILRPVLAREGDVAEAESVLPVIPGTGTLYYPDPEPKPAADAGTHYGFPGSGKSVQAIRQSRARKSQLYRNVMSRQYRFWKQKLGL